MRVLVCCDSFKGTLTAADACAVIARGVERGLRDAGNACEMSACPTSDGGEGFAAILTEAAGGVWRALTVPGPSGEPAAAGFGLVDGGGRAVLDAASACGLDLVPKTQRDPERAMSVGVGVLIAAALSSGVREVLLGVGGTATVDGGLGVLAGLGGTAVDDRGEPLPAIGASVGHVERVVVPAGSPLARLRSGEVRLRIAADVRNPLLGERGAARVFGRQKGATQEAVERLEAGLMRFAERVGRAPEACAPGTGAAGGMAFGLAAMAGATITPGFDAFAEAAGLAERVQRADAVVTGEGAFDRTSAEGKVVSGVAALAGSRGCPVAAVVGRRDDDRRTDPGFAVFPAVEKGVAGARDIEAAAARAVLHLRERVGDGRVNRRPG